MKAKISFFFNYVRIYVSGWVLRQTSCYKEQKKCSFKDISECVFQFDGKIFLLLFSVFFLRNSSNVNKLATQIFADSIFHSSRQRQKRRCHKSKRYLLSNLQIIQPSDVTITIFWMRDLSCCKLFCIYRIYSRISRGFLDNFLIKIWVGRRLKVYNCCHFDLIYK